METRPTTNDMPSLEMIKVIHIVGPEMEVIFLAYIMGASPQSPQLIPRSTFPTWNIRGFNQKLKLRRFHKIVDYFVCFYVFAGELSESDRGHSGQADGQNVVSDGATSMDRLPTMWLGAQSGRSCLMHCIY